MLPENSEFQSNIDNNDTGHVTTLGRGCAWSLPARGDSFQASDWSVATNPTLSLVSREPLPSLLPKLAGGGE